LFTQKINENLIFVIFLSGQRAANYSKKELESDPEIVDLIGSQAMNILHSLMFSLLVTAFVSFTTPLIVVGIVLAVLSMLSYIPAFSLWGQGGATHVIAFLSTFGNGYAVEGIMIIGLTCSFVGGLFDLSNFYRYQNLRNH